MKLVLTQELSVPRSPMPHPSAISGLPPIHQYVCDCIGLCAWVCACLCVHVCVLRQHRQVIRALIERLEG